MTISFVNAGTFARNASTTSRNPAMPASLVSGNLLIAICMSKNNATHSWSGTGWTQFGTQVNNGSGMTQSMAWCIYSGSEAAPTCSWSGAVGAHAIIYQYSSTVGFDPSPMGASNSNTGTGTTHSITGVTTTRAASMVLSFESCLANTGCATPAGWTEDNDGGDATLPSRVTIDSIAVASIGASGDISVTGGNAEWIRWMQEIKIPASTNTQGLLMMVMS